MTGMILFVRVLFASADSEEMHTEIDTSTSSKKILF
jgi:hypothetical protein